MNVKSSWPKTYPAKDGRQIQVRPAAYGDAPVLHTTLLEVAYEGIYIGVEPEGVGDLPAVIERLRRILTNPSASQLVAELDRQVVGSIVIEPGRFGQKDRHWCNLGMWVVAAGRELGVGTALMQAALAHARQEGFEKLVVEVFSSNTAALNLYRKFTFTQEGRQKNQFVLPGIGYVDNILMALEINQRKENDQA